MEEKDFCPLMRCECRDDCAWLIHDYEIDEDGISHEVQCAVTASCMSIGDLVEAISGADDE